MELTTKVLDLLRGRVTCYIATTMPDGSPQLTQVWADTDGAHVVINTVAGFQKLRNVERDPRVAIALSDPADPSSYVQIRGRVVETTEEGAREHIDELAQKYLGRPYPNFSGQPETRRILRIAADSINHAPW